MSVAYNNVTRKEFHAFVAAYPRQLETDIKRFCEPSARAWHDWTLGDAFQSVVAIEHLYEEDGYNEKNTYRILA